MIKTLEEIHKKLTALVPDGFDRFDITNPTEHDQAISEIQCSIEYLGEAIFSEKGFLGIPRNEDEAEEMAYDNSQVYDEGDR